MQTIRTSTHDEFWPSGWLIWASWALAMFDASLIAYIVRLAVVR